MQFNQLYINGNYVPSHSRKMIEVENPATKEIIAEIPRGNAEDVKDAAAAAKQAFPSFQAMPLAARVEYVRKFRDYLEEHEEEIARTITAELGAPLWFSKRVHVRGQIKRCDRYMEVASSFEWEREEAHTIIRKEPVGVVGCITPWNYPLGQIIQKVIPALLMGNTIVLKPSKQTPLAAFYVVDGFAKAGLPAGVLNLVTGQGAEVGNAIATNPDIDMVSFTGSTEGGREVGKLAIDGVKRLALELGGKSPVIFLDEEHLADGVKQTLGMVIHNTGQTCSAWSRAIVLRSLKDAFETEVRRQIPNFVVGDPEQEGVTAGPLSSKKQYEKVQHYIARGKKQARVIVEDTRELPTEGYYVHPIVFGDVNNQWDITQEEIFGPVLCVIYVDDVQEAITVANDTIYGLSGAVFGPTEQAYEVAKAIRTGSLTVNDSPGDVGTPFGGYKYSGIGREGGLEGIEEFVETKTVDIDPKKLKNC